MSLPRYLSDLLEQKLPEVADHDNENNLQGSMHWLADQLDLDDASILLLSLALACHLDAAVGNVVSLCLSDPSKTEATLGLAQKLWDKPEEILLLSDPGHTLFRFGLLENPMINNINNSGGVSNAFDISLRVPPLVANHLIFSRHSQLPPGRRPITPAPEVDRIGRNRSDMDYVASRIKNVSHQGLLVIPILGLRRLSRLHVVEDMSKYTGRPVVEIVTTVRADTFT